MTQTAAHLPSQMKAVIAEALDHSEAETAVATMLAQNFHWNVTAMAFGPPHDLVQKMCGDHFVAKDDPAERMESPDAHATGTLATRRVSIDFTSFFRHLRSYSGDQ